MSQSEPREVYVGSGSFKVDRSRALSKLMEYQLARPDEFLLPWVRCAVASGAANIAAGYAREGFLHGVQLRFDGTPISREELEDPYSGLDQEEDAPSPEPGGELLATRRRGLSMGLAAALRLGPKVVTLTSGRGQDRLRMVSRTLEREECEPARDGREDTILRVLWGFWKPWWPARTYLERVRSACLLCPAALRVGGGPAPKARAAGGIEFDEQGVRGVLELPRDLRRTALTLFQGGVRVCDFDTWLPALQVRGLVNCDRLTLDLSGGVVRQDERLKHALSVVERKAADLAASSVEGLRRDLQRGASRAQVLGWGSRPDVAWLREGCERILSEPGEDSKNGALAVLWNAPLYVDPEGGFLSLAELAEQRGRIGFVPYCGTVEVPPPLPQAYGGAKRLLVAWCPDKQRDLACLEKRFPGALREVGGLLGALPR